MKQRERQWYAEGWRKDYYGGWYLPERRGGEEGAGEDREEEPAAEDPEIWSDEAGSSEEGQLIAPQRAASSGLRRNSRGS